MTRPELHVVGDTFVAALKAFTLQCPKCGKFWGVGRGSKLTSCYNPRTQAFRCTECGIRLRLGIVAWPSGRAVNHGRPLDTMPSPRQSVRLRSAVSGGLWVEGHRIYGKQHVNVLAATPEPDIEVGERGEEGEGVPPSSTRRRQKWRDVEGGEGRQG
jgi:hypothetical protein